MGEIIKFEYFADINRSNPMEEINYDYNQYPSDLQLLAEGREKEYC